MNILVTGGAGYIGSHTAKALRRAGHTPVTLDDLSTGHRESVRWGPFIEGSIADRKLVAELLFEFSIDAVIHFAAKAYVGESMVRPEKYFHGNVGDTMALLSVMLECNVKTIVSSSTCAVYGHPAALPITEEQAPHPVNPYGDSKLFVEKMLRWYGEAHGLRWLALRYFNAAGADPEGELGEVHDPEPHVIPRAMLAARGEIEHFEILGTDYPTPDGTAVRDYIHVSDLADAHVRGLDYLKEGGACRPINLGTGRAHSVREVVRAVETVSGLRVPVRESGRREGDPAILVADPSLAREVLGWEARMVDLTATVETAWAFHEGARSRAVERMVTQAD